ncbi:Adenylosuccinate synthetase, partial [Ilyodon furcidens]
MIVLLVFPSLTGAERMPISYCMIISSLSHAPADLYLMTKNPEDSPNVPDVLEIEFRHGVPVKVMHVKEGKSKDTPLDIFSYLNEIG